MPRAPKKCGRTACEERVTGRKYCDTHTAEDQQRANTTQRGYGYTHQQQRAADAPRVAAGGVRCWRCHQPIQPGQPWHEGHDDHDRTRYRGPEHVRCNTQAGARNKTRGTTPPRHQPA